MQSNNVAAGRILLNVGGRFFETEKDTLRKGVEDGKESYFYALLRHFEKQNSDPAAPLWIDRDGESFSVILAWLRYVSEHTPRKSSYVNELKFQKFVSRNAFEL